MPFAPYSSNDPKFNIEVISKLFARFLERKYEKHMICAPLEYMFNINLANYDNDAKKSEFVNRPECTDINQFSKILDTKSAENRELLSLYLSRVGQVALYKNEDNQYVLAFIDSIEKLPLDFKDMNIMTMLESYMMGTNLEFINFYCNYWLAYADAKAF
jgi:DNA-dependent RNA polymerase auxiliary subunit epsilon